MGSGHMSTGSFLWTTGISHPEFMVDWMGQCCFWWYCNIGTISVNNLKWLLILLHVQKFYIMSIRIQFNAMFFADQAAVLPRWVYYYCANYSSIFYCLSWQLVDSWNDNHPLITVCSSLMMKQQIRSCKNWIVTCSILFIWISYR